MISDFGRQLSFRARAALTGLVLVILLGLLSGGDDGGGANAGYTTAPAGPGAIQLLVRATGHIKAEGQQPVFARVSGIVREVSADYQTPVRKGDVLARIDDQDYRMAAQEAELQLTAVRSELAGMRAKLTNAKQERARTARLYKEDLIPRQELETADAALLELESQLEMMQARVKQAEARLSQARQDVERCTIRSPLDGVLLASHAERGALIGTGGARPLFELAPNLDVLELRVAVTESDIGKVRPGQQALFSVEAYPGEEFGGTVTTLRRSGEERAGVTYYEVLVRADNPDHRLLPGMTAQVRIQAEEMQVERMIPIRALLFNPEDEILERWRGEIDAIRQRGKTLLWVIDDEQGLRPQGVELGVQDAEHVQVVGEWPAPEARVVVGR